MKRSPKVDDVMCVLVIVFGVPALLMIIAVLRAVLIAWERRIGV